MQLPGQQSAITSDVAQRYGHWVPRWHWLALPDDVAQCISLAIALHPGDETAQRAEALWLVRELERTAWRRAPKRPTRRPSATKPSKIARRTGYRRDPARHRESRMKMSQRKRKSIAIAGWMARQTRKESK